MLSPAERAIAEWRDVHPEDSDLPDEAIGSLFMVQRRALGFALRDLGRGFRVAALGRVTGDR